MLGIPTGTVPISRTPSLPPSAATAAAAPPQGGGANSNATANATAKARARDVDVVVPDVKHLTKWGPRGRVSCRHAVVGWGGVRRQQRECGRGGEG